MVALTRPYLGHFVLAVLAMLIVAAVNVTLPYVLGKQVLGTLISRGDLARLNALAILIVGMVLVKGVFFYLQQYQSNFVGQRVVVDLRNRLYDHLQRQSLAFHQRWRSGDIVSRVTNDVGLIQNSLTDGIVDVAQQGITLLGVVGFLLYLNPTLSAITFVVFVLTGVAINYTGARVRRLAGAIQARMADVTHTLQETLAGIRIVKAFTMERTIVQRFRKENERSFDAAMHTVRVSGALSPSVDFLVALGMVIVVWVGGREVLMGRFSPDSFITFLLFLGMAVQPIGTLTRTYGLLQRALGGADRIFQLLDEQIDVADRPGAPPIGAVRGEVRFEDVSFAYAGEDYVLTDIDLAVPPGEVVAIVGSSGAGKSTLVNLIPRFFDPDRGRVAIDGVDIRTVQIASLRRQIGLVPQETILFGVSVAENIGYGNPEASRAAIERAAVAANADTFIRA
ncbi:MAG TPA: ABC transporter ATP-binding protein, partial [Limnochordia bacterium]|nr:ABC transporter ATP-binding protein [Limnochordia bacterium]